MASSVVQGAVNLANVTAATVNAAGEEGPIQSAVMDITGTLFGIASAIAVLRVLRESYKYSTGTGTAIMAINEALRQLAAMQKGLSVANQQLTRYNLCTYDEDFSAALVTVLEIVKSYDKNRFSKAINITLPSRFVSDLHASMNALNFAYSNVITNALLGLMFIEIDPRDHTEGLKAWFETTVDKCRPAVKTSKRALAALKRADGSTDGGTDGGTDGSTDGPISYSVSQNSIRSQASDAASNVSDESGVTPNPGVSRSRGPLTYQELAGGVKKVRSGLRKARSGLRKARSGLRKARSGLRKARKATSKRRRS